jgi:hypothetical protein
MDYNSHMSVGRRNRSFCSIAKVSHVAERGRKKKRNNGDGRYI